MSTLLYKTPILSHTLISEAYCSFLPYASVYILLSFGSKARYVYRFELDWLIFVATSIIAMSSLQIEVYVCGPFVLSVIYLFINYDFSSIQYLSFISIIPIASTYEPITSWSRRWYSALIEPPRSHLATLPSTSPSITQHQKRCKGSKLIKKVRNHRSTSSMILFNLLFP